MFLFIFFLWCIIIDAYWLNLYFFILWIKYSMMYFSKFKLSKLYNKNHYFCSWIQIILIANRFCYHWFFLSIFCLTFYWFWFGRMINGFLISFPFYRFFTWLTWYWSNWLIIDFFVLVPIRLQGPWICEFNMWSALRPHRRRIGGVPTRVSRSCRFVFAPVAT